MVLQNTRLIDVSGIRQRPTDGARQYLQEMITLVNYVIKEVVIWKLITENRLLISQNCDLKYQMGRLYVENATIKQRKLLLK